VPRRFIITAPEWGIYFGNAMGLAFWSLLDPAGMPAAPTFKRASEAHKHIKEFIDHPPQGFTVMAVDCKNEYVMLWELKRQGFDAMLGNALEQFLLHVPTSGSA
jgi:hypothetical protein